MKEYKIQTNGKVFIIKYKYRGWRKYLGWITEKHTESPRDVFSNTTIFSSALAAEIYIDKMEGESTKEKWWTVRHVKY